MINWKYIFTGFLIIANLIFSYSQDTNERRPLDHYKILDTVNLKVYKMGNLIDSSIKIKTLAQFSGNEYFIYLENIDDSSFSNLMGYRYNNSDSIFYGNEICKLIDYQSYINNHDTVLIYKYKYDVESSADEESILYCNPKIGLIAFYNYPWGLLMFYGSKDIPDEIELQLKSDIFNDRY